MRKLDRKRIPKPAILTGAASRGVTETKRAIAFYTDKTRDPAASFTFSVYGEETVKQAVSDLSYNKCAYCEVNSRAVFDSDVEHFRPKGAVTITSAPTLKPGYYWLGSTWENLFLSCQHCNQARVQPTVSGKKRTMGKKNQFPLSDNKKRIKTYRKKVSLEEPYRLLIDPCKDEPLNHLEFDDKGLIYPKKDKKKIPSKKGEASIEVFALVRKMLVEARQTHAIMVMSALGSYYENAKDLELNEKILPRGYVNNRKLQLNNQINNLKSFTRADQVFSGMSLQLIQNFLKKMNIKFS